MAKKKGKRAVPKSDPPCSEPPTERPEISPYTSSPVSLHIGPEQKIYYVPKSLLRNPDWITSSATWGGNIYLASIDENTGHVLVHYLHTGAYQTLHNNKDMTPAEESNIEFKRAILVYAAAKTHSIDGLQELAQDRIEHFGAEMNIFDLVEIIKDDFSKLLGDATWFHDYLEEKTRAMFEEDHAIFARDDFLSCVSDVGLARVLAKCVMRLYNEKIELIASVESASDTRISENGSAVHLPADEDCIASKCSVPDSPLEEHHAGYFSVEEEPAQEPCTRKPFYFREPEQAPVHAAEPEPTASDFFSFGWRSAGKSKKTNSIWRLRNGFAEAIEDITEEAALEAIEGVIEVIDEVIDGVGNACIPGTITASLNAMQTEETDEYANNSIPDTWEDSEDLVEAESEMCPGRVKHLLDGEEWKTCRQCRAMVHQVAIQLARTGHTAKDGYERVNEMLTR